MKINESIKTSPISGHVLIKDKYTNEVILDDYNAIHPQNMAFCIAAAMSRSINGSIFSLSLGNGGTFFNASNQIIYKSPNVIGAATLYNETYSEIVDATNSLCPSGNNILSVVSPNPANSAMIIVTMELDSTEPSGQDSNDNTNTSLDSRFAFDELGLKTPDGKLLSHIIFSPILKTSNRAFVITYTIKISVS